MIDVALLQHHSTLLPTLPGHIKRACRQLRISCNTVRRYLEAENRSALLR